jgi:hypothetical protein
MSIIVEFTATGESNKNTGANDQFREGVTIRHALATDEQEFATVAAAKTLASWKADVDLKKTIPLFEIETLAIGDTADTFFEGNSKYKTKNGKKIRTFECIIGVNSHAALASYNGKTMRVYEFTDAQEIKGVTPDGVKVKGQLVTIEVGKRIDAMPDKPAFTPVTLTYSDYKDFEKNAVIVKPTWSHIELNGIFDVKLVVVSSSATSVKFKALSGDALDPVTSLETANVTFKTALGVAVTHSFVAADANGVYELTGTGFVTGNVVNLNGVVIQTEATYESAGAVSITV